MPASESFLSDIAKGNGVMAYAMIVDINGFTGMVSEAEKSGELIAQFVRDTLASAVDAVEANGGLVVGFMGDAFLALMEEGDECVLACFNIAKKVDQICEYISNIQSDSPELWSFSLGGPALKISVEFGRLDISEINSRYLGRQTLFIGSAINYAARIAGRGSGNRCVVGPVAAKQAFSNYVGLRHAHTVSGKDGEQDYVAHEFSMDDIWIEGAREQGRGTAWEGDTVS